MSFYSAKIGHNATPRFTLAPHHHCIIFLRTQELCKLLRCGISMNQGEAVDYNYVFSTHLLKDKYLQDFGQQLYTSVGEK